MLSFPLQNKSSSERSNCDAQCNPHSLKNSITFFSQHNDAKRIYSYAFCTLVFAIVNFRLFGEFQLCDCYIKCSFKFPGLKN